MAMITEDYVSFETAKLLKEKGFNEPCIWLYSKKGEKQYASDYHSPWSNNELEADEWSCCTQAVAMKWLREVHNIHISITFGWVSGYNVQVDWAEESEKGNDKPACCVWRTDLNTTYEVAVETAIKYCLENLI